MDGRWSTRITNCPEWLLTRELEQDLRPFRALSDASMAMTVTLFTTLGTPITVRPSVIGLSKT